MPAFTYQPTKSPSSNCLGSGSQINYCSNHNLTQEDTAEENTMKNKTKNCCQLRESNPGCRPPACCWTTIDPQAARGPDRSAKWLCVEMWWDEMVHQVGERDSSEYLAHIFLRSSRIERARDQLGHSQRRPLEQNRHLSYPESLSVNNSNTSRPKLLKLTSNNGRCPPALTSRAPMLDSTARRVTCWISSSSPGSQFPTLTRARHSFAITWTLGFHRSPLT